MTGATLVDWKQATRWAVRALPEPVGQLPRRAFVAQIMGLPISIHVRGSLASSPRVAELSERAFAQLRRDDELFSLWKPESPVSRIADGRDRLSDADPRIRRVAELCELATQRTGGAFSAWLPAADGRPRFDPTGLVKGWAVEQALNSLVERLDDLGAHDVLINAGGDIAVHCRRTDTPDWTIAIEDPRDRTRTLRTLTLRSGTVATSGTAARGRHLTDPRTGAPPTGLLSATVIGPELTWADVYATAAFVKGPPALAWIAALPDHAAILIDDLGRVSSVSSHR